MEKHEAVNEAQTNMPDEFEIILPEDIINSRWHRSFRMQPEDFYNLVFTALRVRIKSKFPHTKTRDLDFESLAKLYLEK
jgi:hypothetical protein